MRDIAKLADIQAATAYYYFPSKKVLIKNLFADFYSELTAVYEDFEKNLHKGKTLRETLALFMKKHHEFYNQKKRRFFSFLVFLGSLRNPGIWTCSPSDPA